jgi:hypothetical protein
MNKKFLTKNIKVSIITEEEKAKGLKDTESVQKQSKKHNDEGLKDGYSKLSDLYDFDTTKDEVALEEPPKTNREEESPEDVAAKGPGQLALEYDNEETDAFKDFVKRMDDLNDHSEYEKEFGTHDGFGEGEPNDTYKELTDRAEDYREHRNEYQPTPPVKAIEIKESKTMKRLNYPQEFKDEKHMMSLIKESYKTDDNVFLMADGNQTYKVRWEGDAEAGEGVVLQYHNKQRVNEDTEKMKKLFNYKSSDVVGKTNNYINETVEFKKMMDIIKGEKK